MKEINGFEELIDEFSAACDEMINSKFILADSKISNILKVIASSKTIYNLFSGVLSDFDFQSEFAKCKIPNSFNRTTLKFPIDKKKFIAIVFTLLVEFDARRRDLLKFLTEFFYNEDGVNESYIMFVKTAVNLFKNNVLFLLDNKEEESDEVKSAVDFFNLSDFNDEEERQMDQDELIDLIDTVREISKSVSAETSLNIAEKEEINTVVEALMNALISHNGKLIKISWIAVKNTLKLKKMYDDKIINISQRISRYWTI